MVIWSLYGCCKLASAASLFRVPPIPPQALFPRDIAKKCHPVDIPKSSLRNIMNEWMNACIYVCMFIYLSVYLLVYLIYLFIYLFVYLFSYLFIIYLLTGLQTHQRSKQNNSFQWLFEVLFKKLHYMLLKVCTKMESCFRVSLLDSHALYLSTWLEIITNGWIVACALFQRNPCASSCKTKEHEIRKSPGCILNISSLRNTACCVAMNKWMNEKSRS